MAEWLNTVFYALDSGAFSIAHQLALSTNSFLNPICEILAVLGDGGISFILASLILILFTKTRRTGVAMLLAIGVGALFTNVLLKNLVERPRPYTNTEYVGFWNYVGAHLESEFSFPSGHTTVAMTSMTALFLTNNKKWSWVGFILAVLMAFSRVYLIVHYLTDVLAGLIVGGLAGTGAYFLSKWLFKIVEKNKEKKACGFLLNADLLNLFKKNKKEQ